MSSPEWAALDRRTVAVTALLVAGGSVGAAVPAVYWITRAGSFGTALAWVLPVAALVVASACAFDEVRWRRTRYRVTSERIDLHTGVFVSRRRSLHRDRVRTVDVTADPLLRLFGLVQVLIATGEQTGPDGSVTLRPVTRQVAEDLRHTLLDRASGVTADGLLARLDPAWIRYAPLSFVTPLLGGSAFGVVLNVSDWFGLQSGVIAWVAGLFRGVPLLTTIVVLTAIALVIGLVAALGLFVEMWWAYRLDREPGGTLRVRRGLLTTRSISLEERRLRGVEIVEPLGARLAGAARVDAVATGMAAPSEKDKTDSRTLLPAAPRAVAHRVAADVLRDPVAPPTSTPLSPHPAAARNRRVRWALGTVATVVALLAVLGLLLTEILLHVAWISAFVLGPVAVLLALDAYRSLGHGLTPGYLVARSGTVRRATVALQRGGIIGWTAKQSIFQRRAGLLTLTATTAAGAGAYSIHDVGTSHGLAVAERAVPDLLTPFLQVAEGRSDERHCDEREPVRS
ncbi:PH domain-containing protein [Pseudonocardia xinjiangensis]|uniref:PH domain-containing protein n=1 Tax=Pseudonocardia xinjiangensis TaxID=75289 RepID=UPI003D91942E